VTDPQGAHAKGCWHIEVEGGPRVSIGRDEDTLLRGALRAGIAWPYECSVGGCGGCRFELVDGEAADLWPGAPGLSARERQRGRRLACQTAVRGDLRVRLRLDAPAEPAPAPRRLAARLLAVHRLTADMSEFTFLAEGEARFRPGQYAVLQLPGVPGVRAYSMSNLSNAEGAWQFIVRRQPQGRGSTALFHEMTVGRTLVLDGPYGHAWLRTGTGREIVCLAGGSGLGPMLAIVRGALADAHGPRVQVVVGMRSQADLGALLALQALAAEARGRLSLTTVLSAPLAAPPWSGPTGLLHDEVERTLAPPHDRFDFYLAGPPPMVEALQHLLLVRWRVPIGQVRFDRFV
jgi:toluene monooxygenase electron transfer component